MGFLSRSIRADDGAGVATLSGSILFVKIAFGTKNEHGVVVFPGQQYFKLISQGKLRARCRSKELRPRLRKG